MTTAIVPRKREVPWIGVGISGEWDNTSEPLYESELNFTVRQSAAYDRYGNELPGVMVNHNETTGEILGVTSDQYGVVQNRDAFSLLDPFCCAGGVIEHVGMTVNGMCFMIMRIPGMAFGFEGDDFELYVCAMNSFNGKFPLAIIITPIRVYCQNMFRKLMKKGDTVLMIKHGRFAKERMLSASAASSLLLDYRMDFESTLLTNSMLHRTASKLDEFVERMMPLVPTERPRAQLSNDRIEAQRADFIKNYYHAPDNEKYEGTRLGILNAYYDWITHHIPSRASENFNDVRLGNMMNGTAVSRKLIEVA